MLPLPLCCGRLRGAAAGCFHGSGVATPKWTRSGVHLGLWLSFRVYDQVYLFARYCIELHAAGLFLKVVDVPPLAAVFSVWGEMSPSINALGSGHRAHHHASKSRPKDLDALWDIHGPVVADLGGRGTRKRRQPLHVDHDNGLVLRPRDQVVQPPHHAATAPFTRCCVSWIYNLYKARPHCPLVELRLEVVGGRRLKHTRPIGDGIFVKHGPRHATWPLMIVFALRDYHGSQLCFGPPRCAQESPNALDNIMWDSMPRCVAPGAHAPITWNALEGTHCRNVFAGCRAAQAVQE